eukprot:m.353731 g.353731  ORF g.353731 m.353731 type:complete len:82 (+) comp16829_c0_seq1:1620-1865(+)
MTLHVKGRLFSRFVHRLFPTFHDCHTTRTKTRLLQRCCPLRIVESQFVAHEYIESCVALIVIVAALCFSKSPFTIAHIFNK